MNFFSIAPSGLPKGGHYFFNIVVVTVASSPNSTFFKEYENIVLLDKLTSPRPYIIYGYADETIPDNKIEIEVYDHCVVEINSNQTVRWMRMVDFETVDPWVIIPEIEEGENN